MGSDLNKLAADMPRRIDNLYSDLAAIPQVARGLVWCNSCGKVARAGVECFSVGWPKCCGDTMSLNSPDERRAASQQPNNGGDDD